MPNLDQLRGSMPPLVTPFRSGKVDEKAYASLVEFQIAEGSHGILVNGTTSEHTTLAVAERNRLVDVAIEAARGRIPVVAATGTQSLADTKALTDHAVKAGADALLIVTPAYIRAPQRGLIEYFLEVTRPYDIPWMIYHTPGRAAVSVTVDTVASLRERSRTFVGVKHASEDIGFVSECMVRFGPEFRVFIGLDEQSFPMMAVGACGLMTATGNIVPRLLVELCAAMGKNDMAKARAIHERLLPLNRAIFFDTNPIPLKYMMKRLGLLDDNEHRLPMVRATPETEARLDEVLRHAGVEPAMA